MKLDIFFRLEKAWLVPGESLSPATNFVLFLRKVESTEMALFGKPVSTPASPFLSALMVDLWHRCSSCPCHHLIDWGENPYVHSTCCWAAKGLKCKYPRPLRAWPTETSWQDLLQCTLLRNICQHVENCGKPGAPIQHGASRIKCLSWPLTCSVRNLDRTRGTSQRRKHITYLKSPRMAESIQSQDPQSQWSFESEIMLALSRARRCQQVHLWKAPKVKSCLIHLRDKMPLWMHLIPGQIIGLHIEVGRNVCCNKSNTMLVGQTQYEAGSLERKETLYQLDYTGKP